MSKLATVELENTRLIPIVNALGGLLEGLKPGRANITISDQLDRLLPVARKIEAQLAAIQSNFEEKTPDMTSKPGNFRIKIGQEAEFQKEMEDLMNGKTDVTLPVLTEDDIDRIEKAWTKETAFSLAPLLPLLAKE